MGYLSVRSRRFRALILAGVLATAPAALQAQEIPSADTLPRFELEPVVVSVTRAAALPGEIPQKVEVIGERELDLATGDELVDVLKREVALDVIQYPGLLAGVGIRGFRPQFSGINQRTLLLIDGRPAGLTNLAAIDLQTIERVEVLKGAASALYGSNAMGGAVNIITRRSRGSLRTVVRTEYGSWKTFQGSVAAGGSLIPALDFDLGFAAFQRGADYRVGEGNLFRDLLGDGTVRKSFPNDSTATAPDLGDGETRAFSEYGTLSGNLRLGYQLGDAWRVDARGELFSAEDVQNPGDLSVDFDTRSLKDLGRASADVTVAGELENQALSLKLFAAREDADYRRDPDPASFVSFRTPTRWYGAQLQDAVRFGSHLLVAGADYTSTTAESEAFSGAGEPSAPFSPNSGLESRALFAQGRFAFVDDRLVATVGGRLDNLRFEVEQGEVFGGTQVVGNEESYTVFNPSAGLQYTLPAGVRVHGTAGRAFVAPNAFDVAGYSERPVGPGAIAIARGKPGARAGKQRELGCRDRHRPPPQRLGRRPYLLPDRRSGPDSAPCGASPLPPSSPPRVTPSAASPATSMWTRRRFAAFEWRFGYDLGAALAAGAYRLRLWGNATHIFRAEEISQGAGAEPIRNVADLTLGYGVEYDSYGRWLGRLTGRYRGRALGYRFLGLQQHRRCPLPGVHDAGPTCRSPRLGGLPGGAGGPESDG